MAELRARCMSRHPEIGVRCELDANHQPGRVHCAGNIAWSTAPTEPTDAREGGDDAD